MHDRRLIVAGDDDALASVRFEVACDSGDEFWSTG
jgi:hypothetical protein